MTRRPERLGDLLPGVLVQLAATHTATNGEPPMRSTNRYPTCDRCTEPLTFGHHCWDEKRARAAMLRAIHYFTEDPDRCDLEGREDELAEEILSRLLGDSLIPRRRSA